MNKYGGGARTNKNGLSYEKKISLAKELKTRGFIINNDDFKVHRNDKFFGYYLPKYKLYKFLESKGIDWREKITKRIIPDSCIINEELETVYIIEKKYQSRSGSVDEKLQTCRFKKDEYLKLFEDLEYKVEYIYVLSDWFKRKEYGDVLNHILDMKCYYEYNKIPMDFILYGDTSSFPKKINATAL